MILCHSLYVLNGLLHSNCSVYRIVWGCNALISIFLVSFPRINFNIPDLFQISIGFKIERFLTFLFSAKCLHLEYFKIFFYSPQTVYQVSSQCIYFHIDMAYLYLSFFFLNHSYKIGVIKTNVAVCTLEKELTILITDTECWDEIIYLKIHKKTNVIWHIFVITSVFRALGEFIGHWCGEKLVCMHGLTCDSPRFSSVLSICVALCLPSCLFAAAESDKATAGD